MNIYQHFRPEEREFITKVLQWKDNVENTYSPKLTDFLDPREQIIVKTIVGSHDSVKADFFGGHHTSERKRAIIYPEYFIPSPVDFQIILYEIEYPHKFVSVEHRQVLGSMMSLGLKRCKYGDILLENERVQFFTASEVSAYVKREFTAIGRTSILLKEQPLQEAIKVAEEWQELQTTVSSLRLDAVLAAVYRLSRQKSQNIIGQGLVKVNWTIIENSSFECGEGDIISARGYGRTKVVAIEGKTKKDKWRIVVGKQK